MREFVWALVMATLLYFGLVFIMEHSALVGQVRQDIVHRAYEIDKALNK